MGFRDYLDLELYDFKDLGHEVRYNCPFCPTNNDYKLYVKVANDTTDGLWHCKKCDATGNPISFVMKYNNVGYGEAKDILEMYVDEDLFASNYRDLGLSDTEILYLMMIQEDEEEDKQIDYKAPALPFGTKLIMDNLNNPEVYPFIDYLVNVRKLDPEVIEKYNIGYITNGYALTTEGKKVTLDNHIVFFTFDNQGQYIYWNTRSILKEPYIKSFNGVSKEGEFSKRNTVFNLNIAKDQEEIVIVEGVIDALTIGKSGVATFGKQVTDEQVNIILDNITPEKKIYVMIDRDAPKQADKLAQRLYQRHKNTFIVLNPEDKDANDMGTDKTWELIHNHSVSADSNKRLMLFL